MPVVDQFKTRRRESTPDQSNSGTTSRMTNDKHWTDIITNSGRPYVLPVIVRVSTGSWSCIDTKCFSIWNRIRVFRCNSCQSRVSLKLCWSYYLAVNFVTIALAAGVNNCCGVMVATITRSFGISVHQRQEV